MLPTNDKVEKMGQTIIEKLISKRIGEKVFAGEEIWCPVDLVMGTDATAPLAIDIFEKSLIKNVYDSDKIVLVEDHFCPARDIASANLSLKMREFAHYHKISKYYTTGHNGICHILLPEKGLIKPFDIIVGADSHTCTYGALCALAIGIGSTDMAYAMATGTLWLKVPKTIKVNIIGTKLEHVYAKDIILQLIKKIGVNGANYCSIEFSGNIVSDMSISERLTICNMVAEMGAKCCFMPYDQMTQRYCSQYKLKNEELIISDNDAVYKEYIELDISDMGPQIACPCSPDNVKDIYEVEGTKVDQIVIGSCTNGRTEDFIIAYHYLKGNKISPEVRLLIMPGSQKVVSDLIRLGIAEEMVKSGAVLCPPTCGPCVGLHMGVLGKNQVGLFTTNRNYYGRNGDASSKVYLCSPAVAACSAITGRIQIL